MFFIHSGSVSRIGLLYVLFIITIVIEGCSPIDNTVDDESLYSSIRLRDSLNVVVVNNNCLCILDNDDTSVCIDGGVMFDTPKKLQLDSLQKGWHQLVFYESNDSLTSFYYNRLESLPSVLVPEKLVRYARLCNMNCYDRKYRSYKQESYGIKDAYFGSYHTNNPKVFDEEGIPLFVYNDISYYHPVNISQYALSLWNTSEIMTSQDTLMFLKCANCLGEKITPLGAGPYEFDFVMHGITYKAPWFSGMAQGQMLSVMARAYLMTKDDHFKQLGHRILSFMINDTGSSYPYKGCKVTLERFAQINQGLNKYKDYVIFDEYVGAEATYVLNGNMFGLIGLHDYYEATGDIVAYNAFIDGCRSIAIMLPYYDFYGATSYDLVHLMEKGTEPAFRNNYSHDYNIVLLDALYSYTLNEVFAEYRNCFITYLFPPFSPFSD